LVLFSIGLVCWIIGFSWHYRRPESLWILDLLVIPFMALLYAFGFGAVVVAIVLARRWALAPVAAGLVVLTVLVNPMWRLAPRTWFMVHRPLFNMALETDPGREYIGNELPPTLQFLTADGRVSEGNGNRFFAQWFGIPDDAGGYIYNPRQSPKGADLFGSMCIDPVDLGGGWWMCGLPNTGF
jgi:hypothetical protein